MRWRPSSFGSLLFGAANSPRLRRRALIPRNGTGGRASRWACAALLIGAAALLAAPRPAAAAQGPGVARVSYVQGDVSMLRAGASAWSQALLNTPLVQGDEIYIPSDGRAEIEFDNNDVARLAGGADVTIARFDGGQLQLQLKSGTLSYTIVGRDFLDAQIDTPNMSVHPQRDGATRIDVVDSSHTSAIVWDGSAQVFTPQGSVVVAAGKQIQVEGTDNPQFRVVDAPDTDVWDHWVQQREQRVLDARDYRDHQLNSEIYGGEDLDSYGHWVYVPNYGNCWQPWGIVSGWSPYYYGRWVWTPYYGWSWVSYEPWGWAPFHYGRWFWTSGVGWAWWPGAYAGPHYWAPAYVSFFFGGAGWGAGFGFGGYGAVGWIPLAPYEPYYGYSRARYITNITNITTIYNVNATHPATINGVVVHRGVSQLRNAHAPGGIIAIGERGFGSGRVDQQGRILNVGALNGVRPVRGTAPIAPSRASLQPLPGGRAVTPPARIQNVGVFAHSVARRGAPAVRTPAPVQLHRIDQAMNAARSRAGVPEIRAASLTPAARPAGTSAAARGGVRLGRAETAPNSPAARADSGAAANSGFRSFGGRVSNSGEAAAAAGSRAAERSAANVPSYTITRPENQPANRPEANPVARGNTVGGWRTFSGARGASAPPSAFDRGGESAPAARPSFENHPENAAPTANRGGYARAPDAQPRMQSAPPRQSAPREAAPREAAPRSAPREAAPSRSSPPANRQRAAFDGGARFENHFSALTVAASANNRGSFSYAGRGAGGDSVFRGGNGYSVARGDYARSAPSFSSRPAFRSAPSYSAPRYSAPRYSAPRYSAPHYSAPRYSAPHYSAPHYSAPRGGGFAGRSAGGRGRR